MREIELAAQALRAGNSAAALTHASAALKHAPDDPHALAMFVNAANAARDLDGMVDGLTNLVRVQPHHAGHAQMLATALNNRGGVARSAGRLRAAIDDFRAAIAMRATHPLAWFNLAVCLRDIGQVGEAGQAFERHLQLQPDDHRARLLLAETRGPAAARALVDALDAQTAQRHDAGLLARVAALGTRSDAAADALRRLSPQHDLAAALDAATRLFRDGEATAAIEGAARLGAVQRASAMPALRADLIEALALPAVYTDRADVDRWRARFEAGLARLESDWPSHAFAPGAMPLRDLAHGNFLLAYQGMDDRPLQSRFAGLVSSAASALLPALAQPPPARRSGRVGLLSSFWYECTVGSYFGGWIDWLRSAGFDVYVYQLGATVDDTTRRIADAASTFRLLDASLEHAAHTVRSDDLDLLLYPEIGMDARLMPLAALRLARRQAAAWGHPVTTGFGSIDHFLSCGDMEPEDGLQHYSERRIDLPGLGVDFRRPALPAPIAIDAAGLDPSRPRALFPQSLFKIHPDCDAVLAAIARRSPRVQFVCFGGRHPAWQAAYRARLQRVFAAEGLDVDAHVAWQPASSRARYLQVVQACDAMLDTLHWSGGNTSLDSLLCGVPVVTCPGRFMRGWQTHAMLERLGLAHELSVATPQAQAERVVELLEDPARRGRLATHIRVHLPALFDSAPARTAFIAWAREAIEG